MVENYGEKLYDMYMQACARQYTAVDAWSELDACDKQVWDETAYYFAQWVEE